MRKIPLGAKLATLNIAVLATCCLAIAVTLNLAAFAMADRIEALTISPAQSVKNEDPTEARSILENEAPTNGASALAMTKPSLNARELYLETSAIAIVLTVSVGILGTYLLVRRETRGIEALARHLRGCVPEDLAKPLVINATNQETAELLAAFNSMGARTSAALEAQGRFALVAAHELKNPLAAMRTRLDVFAKRAEPSPTDIARLTETLSTQTDRLSALVSQLLTLARASQATTSDFVDVTALAREVATEISAASNAEIKVFTTASVTVAAADQELLRAAVRNAVENAVAYGEPPVTISCESGRIVVSNAGRTITPDIAETLFEPFRRGDKSRSRASGGCGLGLATTRAIMRAHGGDARFLPAKNGVKLELSFPSTT